MSDKPDLKIVPISPNAKLRVGTLHERIIDAISEYCASSNEPVTKAEICGTLDFVKANIMGLFEQ